MKPRDYPSETRPENGGTECFDTPAAQELNRAMLEHLDSLELAWAGKSGLDVGCGVGHLAQALAQRGCRIVGVDGREENIRIFRQRLPNHRAEVADAEGDLTWLGTFDTVFCFGLLYHLENPIRGLRNMAAVCREQLILETIVCDHELPVAVWDDETKSANQALLGLGCRPSPSLVTLALNRAGFPLIYAPVQPPAHPEFEISWDNSLRWIQDGHVIRSVFVASREPLNGPHLRLLCGTMPEWCCPDLYAVDEIPGVVSISEPVLHNSATIAAQSPLTIVSPDDRWAYSVAFPLHHQHLRKSSLEDPLIVTADLEVFAGEVRFGAVTRDLRELVGSEAVLSQQQGRRTMEVGIPNPRDCGWVVLRIGTGAKPIKFVIRSVTAFSAQRRL